MSLSPACITDPADPFQRGGQGNVHHGEHEAAAAAAPKSPGLADKLKNKLFKKKVEGETTT